MKRFQKFRNTIYFDKFKIMILDNDRFAITDLDFNIIDDLNGKGYKTRRRAANSIKYTHVDKKFKPMNKFQVNKEKVRVLADKIINEQEKKKKSFEDLRNDPEFQRKYEL